MLYFHNTCQEIQKIATYATKGFQLLVFPDRAKPPDNLTRGSDFGPQPPDPKLPNVCYFPQTEGDWTTIFCLCVETTEHRTIEPFTASCNNRLFLRSIVSEIKYRAEFTLF